MGTIQISPYQPARHPWASSLLKQSWGSAQIVTRGVVHQADRLPGFAAFLDGQPAGLVTCRLAGAECEIVSLDSLVKGVGVGSALINAVIELARQQGCRRAWLITTNDNLHVLRFYQKRGFRLAALYINALEASRKLKP